MSRDIANTLRTVRVPRQHRGDPAMTHLTPDQQRLISRHEYLLKFANHPTLTLLLEAHAPNVVEYTRWASLECHGCVERSFESEDLPADWPCPTWELIDRESP